METNGSKDIHNTTVREAFKKKTFYFLHLSKLGGSGASFVKKETQLEWPKKCF